jgi:hypothetical protein
LKLKIYPIILYELHCNIAGAGGAGGGYCAIIDIVPLVPNRCSFATFTNGPIIILVGSENTNVGGINHIFGILGINPFIASYAIASISSFVGILLSTSFLISSFVGIFGIDIPGKSILGIAPFIVSFTNSLTSF